MSANLSKTRSEDFSELLPEGWENWPLEKLQEYSRQLKEQLVSTSARTKESVTELYRNRLAEFEKDALGTDTWWGQRRLAELVWANSRTAVKGGHSVGKTWEIARICVTFLHTFQPSIVITTGPSENQVRNQMWGYIRRSAKASKIDLPGVIKPVESRWDVGDGWYAQGFVTNANVRFRGDHGPNMLIVIDEANGVPPWVWEEAENMCTGVNNKILASGNPIAPTGQFFDCFKAGSGWAQLTLNCLDHPNVLSGRDMHPGAVTRKWVERRIKKYCAPVEDARDRQPSDFEWPRGSGIFLRPSPSFQGRVLGEFPTEGPRNLIPFSWIERARRNELPIDETAPVDLGVDVAYQGGDWFVVFARRGKSVISRRKWQDMDPDRSSIEVGNIIRGYNERGIRVGTVSVDAIGLGASVAPALQRMKDQGLIRCDRILAIQVSEGAQDSTHYANKRAELSFALAERFRTGDIDLSRLGEDADDFENQASQILKDFDGTLRESVESKLKIRDRIGESSDDLDAMYLAFVETSDTFADSYVDLVTVR